MLVSSAASAAASAASAAALPLAFSMPGIGEWIIIAGLGLLFFGKRLPEVGRSLGKGIVEFKKGLQGIEDEVNVATSSPSQRPVQQPQLQQQTGASAYRFDPYTGKPIEQNQPTNPPAAQ
jgi:sec-independent protein translocase protein TatA